MNLLQKSGSDPQIIVIAITIMARIGTVTKWFKRSNNDWDPSKTTLRLDKTSNTNGRLHFHG
ncbi:5479_t:CDS:2 [Entrophospora sp. SA101]|nr:5479_t:CDS:2 [Entrophospora sp. SA101]